MPHARPQPGKWSTTASDKEAKENNGLTRLGSSSTEKEGLLRRAAPAVELDDGGGEIATGGSADRLEQEAEQVADTVTRSSAAGSGGNFPLKEEIRRKGRGEGSTLGGPAQQQIESLKGGGKPLSPSTRSLFEPRFGEDFSEVRVHTGDRADAAARSIGAAAFTQGKDIAFRSDRYRPTMVTSTPRSIAAINSGSSLANPSVSKNGIRIWMFSSAWLIALERLGISHSKPKSIGVTFLKDGHTRTNSLPLQNACILLCLKTSLAR